MNIVIFDPKVCENIYMQRIIDSHSSSCYIKKNCDCKISIIPLRVDGGDVILVY